MNKLKRALALLLTAVLCVQVIPEQITYAASTTATITDDNFLGTGQITLNTNSAGSGYDFTNALTNPKTGDNYGGQGNMWELRLDGQTASCLNFGVPATKGNTYTQVGNAQSLGYFNGSSTINADLRGLIYGYERLLGNHTKFGTSDPGYEKLSYSLRADGILTAADCYMMMQVLTWRLTCGKYCSPSVDYEKALAREIFCDLYGGDNTNWKLDYIEEAYSYLMQCINESRSGNYDNKYSKVTIFYYKADSESNQDLMTWLINKETPNPLYIYKNGLVMGLKQPNATYSVSYTSDMSYCFTSFTTNLLGMAQLELEEGTYYIKETSAPTGAVLDNNIYTLTITDTTSVYNLTDNEITNYLEFNKYEAGTSNLITAEAQFDLYEWNNGLNRYLKVGAIHYDGNGKYSLNRNLEYSYHDENGNVVKTLCTSKLYYTSVNEGKFKIVETKAPAGWQVTNKEITMNTSQDGAVISMMTSATGIGEYSHINALELEKKDTFTGELLSGAVFMIQEKVNGSWYDVGELQELTKTVDGEQVPYYRTTTNQTYSYHDADGTVYKTINNAFPLQSTTYNNGTFRVMEKNSPEGYVGGWSRAFTIVSSSYHVISFTGDNAAENRGKSVAVKTAKYDTTTREKVATSGILTIYEHIAALDEWLEVGKLKFDTETKEYVSDSVLFQFHKEDGSESGKTVDGSYLPGYLYYTSANQGRFLVKEETAPTGYQLGIVSGTGGLNVKTSEILISTTTEDRETIDLTNYENAAQDTGIVVNVELSKFDALTRQKLQGAEFTIQEKVGEDWLDVGEMAYDTKTNTYTTRGMTITLHNSDAEIVYTEESANGLYYTTANLGKYRVVETEAPDNYIKGTEAYSREFDITENEDGIINLTGFEEAAKNIGIRAAVTVRKYDFATQELVKTSDTIFSVHEKIGDTWYKVGELQFNAATQSYEAAGTAFQFHKEDGSVIELEDTAGFESGYLYYTSANQGRFKVTELKAPIHYTLGQFSKEFCITEDNQEFSYIQYENAAKNLGISAMVNLQKYDVMTQEAVNETNAEFTLQEKIGENWLDVGVMTYNETLQAYTSAGQKIVLHDSTGKEIFSNAEGSLYYTSANLGQFRVVETKAPDNYISGSTQYAKEFNVISDSIQGIVDLTGYEKAAKNLGISGKVKTAKYDAITEEKVLAGDAEFTIYEYIEELDNWFAVGILTYEEETREYVSDNAVFTFHGEEGNAIDITDIPDFENGVLYHTTANKGIYKIVETKAPANYTLEAYEKEFNIGTGEDVIDLTALNEAAYDTGVNGKIELVKADSITDERISGATFTVQEWSERVQTWLNVGTLTDHGNGTYSTKNMKAALHTGKEAETTETNALLYTTQNLGQFRIVETEAPAGYLNDMYISDILSIHDDQTVIELTSDDLKATDTPIRVSISKKSITTGKDISGATLTVTDFEGNVIDTWITDGSEHILSAIPAGKYILTEERAPEGYLLASSVEFEVTETAEIQKVEMFDEEVKGRLVINKVDTITGAALAGAAFELKDEEGNVIQTLVTDENGHAESDLLNFGIYDTNGSYLGSKIYTLTEVTSPNGYKLDGSPVTIEFQYQDDQTEVVEVNVTVKNEREPEVPTGDKTDMLPFLILMLGTVLVLGTGIYGKKKNRQ